MLLVASKSCQLIILAKKPSTNCKSVQDQRLYLVVEVAISAKIVCKVSTLWGFAIELRQTARSFIKTGFW